MSTYAVVDWREFAVSVNRSDWAKADSMLRSVGSCDSALLLVNQDAWDAASRIVGHGPLHVQHALNSTFGFRSPVEMLAYWLVRLCLDQCAEQATAGEWGRIPELFSKALRVPVQNGFQQGLVLNFVELVIQVAIDTERLVPPATLENDDYTRLTAAAVAIEKLLGNKAEVFGVTASLLRDLGCMQEHSTIAAIALKEALGHLHWPVLRHMGWLATTRLPLPHDPDWPPLLAKRPVRMVSVR